MMPLLAWSAEATLVTLNTVELAGIVYLAIALSALRERIARMEGYQRQPPRGDI
jgi:hypothetical protein